MTDIIAASKSWFFRFPVVDGFDMKNYRLVTEPDELSLEMIRNNKPRYVFFPHWNWRVEDKILEEVECVAFHLAPLPEGRGGSPIQNLILRGFTKAPLNSLRMSAELDGGPIYCSSSISLDGTAEEIFLRMAEKIQEQIITIQETRPVPVPQVGQPSVFKRLGRSDNEILPEFSIDKIWDYIRMVDSPDYRPAFLHFGQHQIEFSQASFSTDGIEGKFLIRPKDQT